MRHQSARHTSVHKRHNVDLEIEDENISKPSSMKSRPNCRQDQAAHREDAPSSDEQSVSSKSIPLKSAGLSLSLGSKIRSRSTSLQPKSSYVTQRGLAKAPSDSLFEPTLSNSL